MANKIDWIRGEIDAWQREGVVGVELADRLRARYPRDGRASRSATLISLAVLGALLIGGGIILLLAHNWADLGRPLRIAVALLPLIAAQALALFGAVRGRTGAGWREGVGVFWTLAIGAAIAMVSQIYHLSGTYDGFMLTWILLTLPVMYLLRSSLTGVLFTVGVLAWAMPMVNQGIRVWLYWPLTLAVVPLLWMGSFSRVFTPGLSLLRWVLSASLFFGVGITFEPYMGRYWMLYFSGLASILYLLDMHLQKDAPSLWHRPMRIWGALIAAWLPLMLTYRDVWTLGGIRGDEIATWELGIYRAVLVLMPVAVLALAVLVRKQFRVVDLFPAGLLFATLGAWWITNSPQLHGGVPLFFNGFVAAYGLARIVHGFRRASLRSVNIGMLLLVAVIVLRFFDSDLSMVARGIIFIVLGVLFLSSNIVLARKFRRVS